MARCQETKSKGLFQFWWTDDCYLTPFSLQAEIKCTPGDEKSNKGNKKHRGKLCWSLAFIAVVGSLDTSGEITLRKLDLNFLYWTGSCFAALFI